MENFTYTLLYVAITVSILVGHWEVKQFAQRYITKTWNQISKIKSLDSTISFLVSHFWLKGDVLALKLNYFIGRVISYCSYVPHIVPITMQKKKILKSSWNNCSKLKCQNLNILHVPTWFPLSNSYDMFCTLNYENFISQAILFYAFKIFYVIILN